MIYKYIQHNANRRFFRSVINILVFSFTFATSSCYSSYNSSIRPESLINKLNYNIVKVIMKDGIAFDLRGTRAVYESNYKDQKNVLVFSKAETTYVRSGVINVSSEEIKTIEVKDIQSIIVEKEEINTGMTILATVGIVVAVAVIVGIIIVASSGNEEKKYVPPPDPNEVGGGGSCPFVYSLDGDKYILDAEPYGGAITEGLKKIDYSRLKYLKASGGKYKILMRNEMDETQNTDEMKLMVIDHPVNTEVAADIKGQMTVFEKVHPPLSVTDENGKDITLFFKERDDIDWQTSMPFDTVFEGENLKHELTLKFPKPKDAKNAKLLFKEGTAKWGEMMVRKMLEVKGNKIDDWYADINKGGNELLKFKELMIREEMYVLKVNVQENGSWVTKGYVTSDNPYVDKELIVDLDIGNVTGDTLCIKLTPPCGFWKFDFAGAIYESTGPANIIELPVSRAIDENGIDLRDQLSATDNRYYSMPETSNFANIEFDVPVHLENMSRSLILKTTGYYDIHLTKDKPEQTELVQKIFDTPGLILEIAMKEYYEFLRSSGLSEK